MSLHPDPAYPASRAFVLKLHRDGRPEAGVWQGRVEHMVSGRHHDFQSSEALLHRLSQMSRSAELAGWVPPDPLHPYPQPEEKPMEFTLYCIDKPRRAELRAALRVPHLVYAQTRQQAFRYGGPLMDESGQPRGSLMILRLPDRAALDAHMQGDPFFAADLFESVSIWATRQVMPEAEPGALDRELEAARALAGRTRKTSIPILRITGEHAP